MNLFQSIIQQNNNLCMDGYRTKDMSDCYFEENRKALIGLDFIIFFKAVEWINLYAEERFNLMTTTKYMKQEMEKDGVYVPFGVIIAACIYEQFQVMQLFDAPGAMFKLYHMKSFKRH